MTREEKYDTVNKCETFEQLAEVIESFADEDGMIEGRTQKFNAKVMAQYAKNFNLKFYSPNRLTRQFGIRQQAFYIEFCNR